MNTTIHNYKNDPRFPIFEELYQDANSERFIRDIFFAAMHMSNAIKFADLFVESTGDITELVSAWKHFKKSNVAMQTF